MRHRVQSHRLSRRAGKSRRALLRALLTSLATHGHVTTTSARAAALVPAFESLVTRVRRNGGNSREGIRAAKTLLFGEAASRALIGHILPKIEGRASGFVRTTPQPPRAGDCAPRTRVDILFASAS